MRVAVIGGGPSGLVTLKFLRTAHEFFHIEQIEAKLFESASDIGGVYTHHTYEDGEMVSSKYYTTFSDFRPRPEDPVFLSTERYLVYLKDYANYFDLWPSINLSTTVVAVRRGGRGGHVVTYRRDGEEQEWECDAIAVCSGLHETPNMPSVPGLVDKVPVVMHSADFKSRKQFGIDKTVVVLGAGETSFDICHLAITSPTKQVVLCHRNGFWPVPKKMPTVNFFPWRKNAEKKLFSDDPYPIDVSGASLFDTMYVHPAVRDSMFIWNYHDTFDTKIGSLPTTGSPSWNSYVGVLPKDRLRTATTIVNKAYDRVVDYIAPAYRPKNPGLLESFRRLIVDVPRADHGRYITVAPWPTRVDSLGAMHFPADGSPEYERIKHETIKPDVVIFATGYKQTFPFLPTPASSFSSDAYPTFATATTRSIWSPSDPTVGFIGFVRPGIGAIPSIAEMQAMLFVQNLLGQVPGPLRPEDEWHTRILSPPGHRLQYGVEHESYVYQLAKDMGVAPGVLDVLKLGIAESRAGRAPWWRLPVVWAGSANINTKFRMVGPWRWERAVEVMNGEIWGTVSERKGIYGNVYKFYVPVVVLGAASMICWIYYTFLEILASVGLVRDPKPPKPPQLWVDEVTDSTRVNGTKQEYPNGAGY